MSHISNTYSILNSIPDTYSILNSADLSKINFQEIGEASVHSLRYSLDLSLFVIKYEMEHIPNFIMDGQVTPVQTLTKIEAVELMRAEAWQTEEPETE